MNGTEIILFDATWKTDTATPPVTTYGTFNDLYAAEVMVEPGKVETVTI